LQNLNISSRIGRPLNAVTTPQRGRWGANVDCELARL